MNKDPFLYTVKNTFIGAFLFALMRDIPHIFRETPSVVLLVLADDLEGVFFFSRVVKDIISVDFGQTIPSNSINY